jgi:hypothetical protein
MDEWEKIGLFVFGCLIIGSFERQLSTIIKLLEQIRDRPPRL